MTTTSTVIERDVEMVARDGTVLRADVCRPRSSDTVPVLLQRTPYNKALAPGDFPRKAVERGYAVVIQDTRGCWASEGAASVFRGEKRDGYDAVTWAAAQPWCDGRVGMYGSSYVAYTQFMAASLRPPALKAIFPVAGFHNPYSVFHLGGAPALGIALSWGLGAHGQIALARHEAGEAEKAALAETLMAAIEGLSTGETFRSLPVLDTPIIGRDGITSFLNDILTPWDVGSAFWSDIGTRPDEVRVPAYHVGGWYDIFARQTIDAFAKSQAHGRTDHWLLMGPWLHGPLTGLVGDVDFTSAAAGDTVFTDKLQFDWFDHWLKGLDNGVLEEPRVRIFVMGANAWRDEATWPLARERRVRCYLHSSGNANTLDGDGTLSFEGPGTEPADTFVYDPRDPVPTRGGRNCCCPATLPAGAFDQREIEQRLDVLVYTSSPLDDDLEVTGQVLVRLWAATSARDTDFTAKLVDVAPSGFAHNVCDGVIRARHRRSCAESHLVEPYAVLDYTIDLGPTSNVFLAGHRIRLEVSSSNFPKIDRNPNTGGPTGTDTQLRPASQTVFHDGAHASYLDLPVIRG